MEEDLSIISTNTRNEKIRNFFVNNKNKIITLVIIIIIVAIGLYTYDKYVSDQKKEISENFNSISVENRFIGITFTP